MQRRFLVALALACLLATPALSAEITCDHLGCHAQYTSLSHAKSTRHLKGSTHQVSDARPRAWCGWWLRHYLGVADRALNRAARWAGYGSNAHGPAIGTIVVWRHHVGIITGKSDKGWIVKSGNDGHAVRERARSLKGAIAFRWPNGVASR